MADQPNTDTPQTDAGNLAPQTETPQPATETEKTYTQAEFDALWNSKPAWQDRVNRLRAEWEKEGGPVKTDPTLQDRIAELEKTIAEERQRALQATLTSLASDFHPGVEKFLDLDGLTAADSDKIQGQLDALKASHPYLVKASDPAPVTTPAPQPVTPGANAPGGTKPLLSREALAQITGEQLHADPELKKLYIESKEALRLTN